MDKEAKKRTLIAEDNKIFLQISSVTMSVAVVSLGGVWDIDLGIGEFKGHDAVAPILMNELKENDKTSLIQETLPMNSRELVSALSEKSKSQLTSFEKMDLTHIGISKKGLEQLKTRTRLDYDRLAKMLSTTKVTLINKKGDEKFNASLSEKILSVADIYSYGYEVFEDEERFNRWMLSPIRALGGKAPYEIMDNQFGREEVKDIIGRIDYGVYS